MKCGECKFWDNGGFDEDHGKCSKTRSIMYKSWSECTVAERKEPELRGGDVFLCDGHVRVFSGKPGLHYETTHRKGEAFTNLGDLAAIVKAGGVVVGLTQEEVEAIVPAVYSTISPAGKGFNKIRQQLDARHEKD